VEDLRPEYAGLDKVRNKLKRQARLKTRETEGTKEYGPFVRGVEEIQLTKHC